MKNTKSKRNYVLSVLLKKYIIHKNFDVPYNEIIIRIDSMGRPFWSDNDPNMDYKYIDFNVSHDHDCVIIGGVTDNRIGVDVVYTKEILAMTL